MGASAWQNKIEFQMSPPRLTVPILLFPKIPDLEVSQVTLFGQTGSTHAYVYEWHGKMRTGLNLIPSMN